MSRISSLWHDSAGRAGVKFVILATLTAVPLLYPSQTLSVIDGAQAQWENLWTIDGLSGGRA